MRSLKTKWIELSFIAIVFAIIFTASFCLSYALLVIVKFLLENFDLFWIALTIAILSEIKIIFAIMPKFK